MPNMNDFHAFKSTSSGGGSGKRFGCLPVIIIIGIVVIILILIGNS